MNRQLLLALQKRNTERLEVLQAKLNEEGLTQEELDAINAEIETISAELTDVAEALANMEEAEDQEDSEARSKDQGHEDESEDESKDDEDTENESSENNQGEARGNVTPEARAAAMTAIKKTLATKNAKSTKKREAEIRSAFANFVVGRITEAEARSLGIVVGQGNVMVPTFIRSEIISYAQEENLLRKYGTPHRTKGYEKYPVLVKKADAAATKTERTSNMPETDIEFDEILLDPTEFDALATVSQKLVLMSSDDIDVENIVIEELKKAYVRKETNYMFNGNDAGAENPGALAKKAVAYYEDETVDINAAGLTNKLYRQLVKMKGQVKTEVRKKAKWIVNSAAFTALEGLLDANGRPLLYETPDGMGYKLLGHMLDYTDAADGNDPSVPVFYFGDFKSFHIQDVLGAMQIKRLVEAFALQNKIGFQVYNLVDGQLIYSPLEPTMYRYEVGVEAPPPGP